MIFLYFNKRNFLIFLIFKNNFLIFLGLKDKNSCFFPGEPCRVFDFLPFSGVSIFHLSRVFSISSFSGAFSFHHSRVFPCFTFLRYFIFHLFPGFLCCCTASATDSREPFLLSGAFYLKLLHDIWHNLLLSRLH